MLQHLWRCTRDRSHGCCSVHSLPRSRPSWPPTGYAGRHTKRTRHNVTVTAVITWYKYNICIIIRRLYHRRRICLYEYCVYIYILLCTNKTSADGRLHDGICRVQPHIYSRSYLYSILLYRYYSWCNRCFAVSSNMNTIMWYYIIPEVSAATTGSGIVGRWRRFLLACAQCK